MTPDRIDTAEPRCVVAFVCPPEITAPLTDPDDMPPEAQFWARLPMAKFREMVDTGKTSTAAMVYSEPIPLPAFGDFVLRGPFGPAMAALLPIVPRRRMVVEIKDCEVGDRRLIGMGVFVDRYCIVYDSANGGWA